MIPFFHVKNRYNLARKQKRDTSPRENVVGYIIIYQMIYGKDTLALYWSKEVENIDFLAIKNDKNCFLFCVISSLKYFMKYLKKLKKVKYYIYTR